MVTMPGAGAGDAGAVQLAPVMPQFVARPMQIAPLFAHFAAILHDFTVNGVNTGIRRSRAGVGLGNGGGNSRGQREERGGQQKLAHRILLQTGSHPCDHR